MLGEGHYRINNEYIGQSGKWVGLVGNDRFFLFGREETTGDYRKVCFFFFLSGGLSRCRMVASRSITGVNE